VITHSKFVENIIEREFDIKPKMISYPYIGKKILGRKKVVKKKVDLLFMGRIDYLKGAHLLPEIASILEKKGIPYKIDVMGSGSMINKLKILSEKHRLKIQFHGFVNHMSKKFLRIMEDTHILLIPSLWYEPFGIVVLEAMAFGIPVIASNRGGLKEIVTENNVGILAYPNAEIIADEIENLIKDKKRYEKFSENGLKNIKKYKPENVFKEYEKIFEKVV
jgi:glycosyltransferase involved in cell wall biosynthesis